MVFDDSLVPPGAAELKSGAVWVHWSGFLDHGRSLALNRSRFVGVFDEKYAFRRYLGSAMLCDSSPYCADRADAKVRREDAGVAGRARMRKRHSPQIPESSEAPGLRERARRLMTRQNVPN